MALRAMLQAHPYDLPVPQHAAALEALADCIAHCRACADACLAGDDVAAMRQCIRTDLDCAAICGATLEVIAHPGTSGAPWRRLLALCIEMCEACAEECGEHDTPHCRACAEACRAAADACRTLLEVA